MILADVSILSTFVRVGALELLFDVFSGDEMGVTPAVYEEVRAGVREGRLFLRKVLDLVDSGRLKLVTLTSEEVLVRPHLPPSLGNGEAESIAVCQARKFVLLTNDKRARNFGRTQGLEVYDLVRLLRSLWRLGVCSKRRVRQITEEMEGAENMVIKNKDEIFGK